MGGGGALRYIGDWGALGPKVKSIVTYSLSPMEQRAFAGALSKGIFNVYRRTTSEVLNVLPGLLVGYGIYYWAKTEHARLQHKDLSKYENEQ